MRPPLPALTLALGLLAPALPGPARADDDPPPLEQAQEHIDEGEALFRAGRHAAAARRLLAAEEVLLDAEEEVPPALYWSLARCYDQQGQLEAAMRYYAKFLGLVDASATELKRSVARARDAIERLRARLEQTSLQFEVEPDGAEVRMDRRVLGTTPLDPVQVTPGPHQVTVWAEGYEPASVDLEVAAGTTVPVVLRLVPEEEPAPPPAETGSGTSALLWWVGGGVAVLAAGAVVGVVLLTQEPEPDTYQVPAPVVVGR